MTKNHEQLIKRIREELNDSYDEERELEYEDHNTDEITHALLASETDEYRESRRVYFKELFRMQAELVKLQDWIVKTQKKVVILFEGRDAAGQRTSLVRHAPAASTFAGGERGARSAEPVSISQRLDAALH